jgi:hypothetical protein
MFPEAFARIPYIATPAWEKVHKALKGRISDYPKTVKKDILKVFVISLFKFDEIVRSPTPSLRGAKRRGNLLNIRLDTRLLRFARNDQWGVFGLPPSRE